MNVDIAGSPDYHIPKRKRGHPFPKVQESYGRRRRLSRRRPVYGNPVPSASEYELSAGGRRTRWPAWMRGLHSENRSRVQSPNRHNLDVVRPATVLGLRVWNRFVGRCIRSYCGCAGGVGGLDVDVLATRERDGLKDHGGLDVRLRVRRFGLCRRRGLRLDQPKRIGYRSTALASESLLRACVPTAGDFLRAVPFATQSRAFWTDGCGRRSTSKSEQ